MDYANLLLGTIFVVLSLAMAISGGYAYATLRKMDARRKR